ncbi:hypothetical protein RI129_011029 [Pyrocoelia pectoralis]|uniref:MADF domain-containing protein n=1 Tax=Pyrocoelia pectoralis TaxID=417401 RepID=A0AAN7V762_9COLE
MNDEKLIILVQNYECLFNLAHKDYSDNNIKWKIWKTIGEELGVPANDCKQRWFSLRDQFRRVLKTKKTVSGQAAMKKKKWKYADELSFLMPYFQERETISNISPENESDKVTTVEDNDNENEREVSWEQGSSTALENEELSQLSQSQNRVTPFKPPSVLKPKKAKVSHSQPAESPSTALMKYIISKNEQPTSTNAVDAFLAGIGETIKTFPPVYQNMAKSKIFNIVSEIELQLLAPARPQQQPMYDRYQQPVINPNYVEMSGPSPPMQQQYAGAM